MEMDPPGAAESVPAAAEPAAATVIVSVVIWAFVRRVPGRVASAQKNGWRLCISAYARVMTLPASVSKSSPVAAMSAIESTKALRSEKASKSAILILLVQRMCYKRLMPAKRRSGPLGKIWCSRSRHFVSWRLFARKSNGLWSHWCKPCGRTHVRQRRAERGITPRAVRGPYRQISVSTGKRRCSLCHKIKSLSQFWRYSKKRPDAYHSRCSTCMLKSQEPYRAKNSKACRDRARAEVLAAYGGRCVCCGETEPAFLAIDHVKNDGARHRARIGAIVFWLRKHDFPKDRFQLLCHNCNRAKHTLGRCPHHS